MQYETEVFDIDELVREAYEAGRMKAFLEAAEVCEILADSVLNNEAYSQACLDCVAEIIRWSGAEGEKE